MSGHYYFHDFWCADSGTIPALLILELLSVEGCRLSELIGAFRERYFISGEINSEVADQEAKMRELAERYADGEVSWLDGVSVDYPEWHFNVRPSNTEPLLRLNLESLVSPEDMERKRDAVLELLSNEGRSLSELLEPLRSRYFISGEINSEVDDQDARISELKERYSDGDISELDGVSVDYDDWHFNVRASNTEPLLRLNLESVVSREHMDEKRDEVLGLIRRS